MPLTPISELLRGAQEQGYALGYFESWNLESLLGVVDAAESTRSPIIIGFNGDFLSRAARLAPERLSWYAGLGVAAAESAAVPCGLIFNECAVDDWTREAISCGFNLVSVSDPEAEPSDFMSRVSLLASEAHEHDVAIEAELGELPSGLSENAPDGGLKTDPELAGQFVEATGVDLLAVSAGNVHVLTQGSRELDLELLADIRRRVSVPLVLHGGTGIARGSLTEAIRLGVAKVNYGTYLKQRYLSAVGDAIARPNEDPHRLLGIGGDDDVMVAGRLAVRDAVLERIGHLGCFGKA